MREPLDVSLNVFKHTHDTGEDCYLKKNRSYNQPVIIKRSDRHK